MGGVNGELEVPESHFIMHSYNYEPSPVSVSVSSPLSVSQGYQRSNHFIATQGECEIPSNSV